jgi:hypothetical protein
MRDAILTSGPNSDIRRAVPKGSPAPSNVLNGAATMLSPETGGGHEYV